MNLRNLLSGFTECSDACVSATLFISADSVLRGYVCGRM